MRSKSAFSRVLMGTVPFSVTCFQPMVSRSRTNTARCVRRKDFRHRGYTWQKEAIRRRPDGTSLNGSVASTPNRRSLRHSRRRTIGLLWANPTRSSRTAQESARWCWLSTIAQSDSARKKITHALTTGISRHTGFALTAAPIVISRAHREFAFHRPSRYS